MKASSATAQHALSAHWLNKLDKKVKIILHHDISKDMSCKWYDARLGKAIYRFIATRKAFRMAMFRCSIVVIWKNWISSWNSKRCSTNKSDICSTQVCCKFRQLHLSQILFKLAFISHSYYERHRGELFFETQCIWSEGQYVNILFSQNS